VPVELVTIPADLYAELLDCRRQLAELKALQRAFERPSKSPIERDAEVAAFLAERFGRATVATIRTECLGRFGRARTPARSSIYRYWSRLRSDKRD
jgi:hypothetical protein